MTEKSDNNVTKTTLKCVHIAISNTKRTLLGVFHKIKGKYLQLYLNPNYSRIFYSKAKLPAIIENAQNYFPQNWATIISAKNSCAPQLYWYFDFS